MSLCFHHFKESFTYFSMIFAFSSTVLSYGNFSRGLRGGPNLYYLPPLAVLLDARATAAVFFRCLQAEKKEAECYHAPEQPERRRLSSAVADEAEEEAGCSDAPVQAEKEAECRHTPEKEAECLDHSPEEEAKEEAECPDSPEEEEETEASSSEG